MIIEDGKGKNGSASVSQAQRLNVSAKSNPRVAYVSRDSGKAFRATFFGAGAADDYIAYLKNASAVDDLYIDEITLGGVESILWKIAKVNGTAGAGAAVTPVNLNFKSGLPAAATAMNGDTPITGLTAVGLVGIKRSRALESASFKLDSAVILGPGDALAIEYDTGTSGVYDADILFHYEAPTT